MVLTLDDTKRLAIATKLAQMKALQNLLINNEEILGVRELTGQEPGLLSSKPLKANYKSRWLLPLA